MRFPVVSTNIWRLRPRTFFSPVKAAFATGFGRFHRLTVNNGCCWFGMTSICRTHLLAEGRMDTFPGAIPGPLIKGVPNRPRGREIRRDVAPLDPGTIHIEQCINDRT